MSSPTQPVTSPSSSGHFQVAAFGKYTLLSRIGRGGMGEVFLAAASGLGGFRKLVVVKRLYSQYEEEPAFVRMLVDEARLAARLNHPNIVQTHEVDEYDGSHFIAMEFLEGQSLDRMLKQLNEHSRRLTMHQVVAIGSGLLDGLHYAHELTDYDGTPLEVVHRDISPHNVIITYRGGVKLLDFGIAKAATQVAHTKTGEIKGKYAYMSPEQAMAYPVDRRSDIWSVGVLLWEATAGRRLFPRTNDINTLRAVIEGKIESLHEVDPSIPREISDVIQRALSRNLDERYQTCEEFQHALEQVAPHLPKTADEKRLDALMVDLWRDEIEKQKDMIRHAMVTAWPEAADHEVLGTSDAPTMGAATSRTGMTAIGRGSRKWWVVAGAVGIVLLGAAVTLQTVRKVDAPAKGVALTPTTPRPEVGETPDTTPTAGTTVPTPSAGTIAGQPSVADAGVELAQGDGEDEQEFSGDDEDPQKARGRRRIQVRRRGRGATSAQRVDTESDAPGPSATPPAASQQYGYLFFDTVPWSQVYLDGRLLGMTPLFNVRLAAGSHTLLLRNPEAGIEKNYQVEIQADETFRRRIAIR